MLKCKQSYLSQNKMKDESGITLVELLAAISILSVVILLAGSIHLFGQRHFINQSESATQANDLSYAMTVMTRDLRKKDKGPYTSNTTSISDGENILFFLDGDILKTQNGEVLAESVEIEFVLYPTDAEIKTKDQVKITLTDANNENKTYHTTVYFRGETNNAAND